MKTMKIFILFLATTTVLLSACIDLEREDYTEVYPENFYKTETDLKLAVNALYIPFGTDWDNGIYAAGNNGYQVFTEMTTDAMECSWGWEWDRLHYHEWNSNITGGIESILWNAFNHYNFLSTARNVIRRIEASTAPETAKVQYAAEARALRGWMGLYLYDLFGTVPVAPDKILDNPEQIVYLPRLTEEEYDHFMEEDLLAAIENLPETASGRGRMTKGAARMILLKYYMIKGYFQKAEKIARDLYAMESSVYELLPSYSAVFTKENTGNKEIILQIPCNNPGMPNYYTAHLIPSDYYWTDKAANYGGYVIPWDFYDLYDNNDARKKTLVSDYTNKTGKKMEREKDGNLIYGALPVKYGVDPDHSGDISSIDLIIYRYSDVLLTLAECINRNNKKPTQEAIDLVNRIRNRAGIGYLPASAAADDKAFNHAVLAERGIEFYAEGIRRQDLIRFGQYIESANERILKSNATKGTSYSPSENFKSRFFIPVNYINESKNAILQNDGYVK